MKVVSVDGKNTIIIFNLCVRTGSLRTLMGFFSYPLGTSSRSERNGYIQCKKYGSSFSTLPFDKLQCLRSGVKGLFLDRFVCVSTPWVYL